MMVGKDVTDRVDGVPYGLLSYIADYPSKPDASGSMRPHVLHTRLNCDRFQSPTDASR